MAFRLCMANLSGYLRSFILRSTMAAPTMLDLKVYTKCTDLRMTRGQKRMNLLFSGYLLKGDIQVSSQRFLLQIN